MAIDGSIGVQAIEGRHSLVAALFREAFRRIERRCATQAFAHVGSDDGSAISEGSCNIRQTWTRRDASWAPHQESNPDTRLRVGRIAAWFYGSRYGCPLRRELSGNIHL